MPIIFEEQLQSDPKYLLFPQHGDLAKNMEISSTSRIGSNHPTSHPAFCSLIGSGFIECIGITCRPWTTLDPSHGNSVYNTYCTRRGKCQRGESAMLNLGHVDIDIILSAQSCGHQGLIGYKGKSFGISSHCHFQLSVLNSPPLLSASHL